MIYVTLGTQNRDFSRPLKEIDRLIDKGIIKDEIYVQAGSTKYHSDKMNIFTEIANKDYIDYMKRCNLLITHGGIGSITDGLKYNKKIIVIPRLKKYDEHVNDHQLDIVNAFYNKGLIEKVIEMDELEDVIKNISNFKPANYVKDNKKMLKIISNYIDNN